MKKAISLMLALFMLVSCMTFTASAAASEYDFKAAGDVTLSCVTPAAQTVEVSFLNLYDNGEGDEGTYFYAVNLHFDTADSTGKLTLTELRCGAEGVAAPLENDPATGHVVWTDASYANGILAKVNAPIWTAVYTVAADAAPGDYTVKLQAEAIGLHPDRTDEYSSDKDLSYTATVTVKSHSIEAVAAREATCEEDGWAAHYKCADCGKLFSDEAGTTEVTAESLKVPALGHDYTVTYTWDDLTCTAKAVCSRDAAHTVEETVKATLTGTITAPTEEAEGEGEYTAVFANDVFTAQTITHAIPRLSAYELYLENSALEQDAAGNYKVEPGQTVQLTLYAKSNQNTKLQALLVNIGNDAALTNVGFTPAEGTVITAGATSGTNTKLLKVQDDTPITLSAGTPVALGVMSVKVPEGVSGNQFKLTFDGGTQQFSVEGSIDEINPTCTGATLVIAKDCTVSFDTDGDGTPDETVTVPYGEKVAPVDVPAVQPKEGYTADGWEEGDPTVDPITGDATYTAKYRANKYKVAFHANGGEGTMAEQEFAYDAEQKLSKNAFTWTGKSFTGWNTAADGSGESYGDEQGVKNLTAEDGAVITLYAQWDAQQITVTLDPNGGSLPAGTEDTLTVNYGDNYPDLSGKDPVKDGYRFIGWNTAADGSGEAYDATKPADRDLTVYAQYEAVSYTVTYSGVETAIPAQTYTIDTADTVAADPVKTGYRFTGWVVKETAGNWTKDEAVASGASLNGRWGDVELVAQWAIDASITLENYRYANSGWKLLTVAGVPAAGQTYTFDGEQLYYTDDNNYIPEGSSCVGVYITLIEVSSADTMESLFARLAIADKSADYEENYVVKRDGDVNGNGHVDIADVNVVYQMLQHQNAYSMETLGVKGRLEADMNTSLTSGRVLYHGSIEDADAILSALTSSEASNG